ncbi:hypothetical protein GGX14DRAFT_373271 [Mycena pura]|uniref:Uncharacterized protein n=1 Tax=Mycena pura TaxID=153505 RepID=A0AAD6YAH4_9AGAR|nr:hypothetical protein GGX14DRAFT_382684 [Mycena pura]KAJ7199258.1 hypothetical protein GGX14DRAFT_373271 [Mycena pura]
MPPAYTTIATASQPRIRNGPHPKTAPRTAEQLKAKREAHAEKQAQIDAEVGDWFSATLKKAEELGERFDMKPRYFLDMFFQGGARMVHHQEKVNAYNAFKHEKAVEIHGDKPKTGAQLHEDHYSEYQQLTEAEKAELIERFLGEKARNYTLRRDTPRAKIQDIANIVRNIKMLLTGLKQRAGIEGFFLIVRNTAEFHMPPEWYFTCRELEEYMPIATRKKWDTGEVGAKVEAFAVAGMDTAGTKKTSSNLKARKNPIRAKPTNTTATPRNDVVTRAALGRLKRKQIVSPAIVTSDDSDEGDATPAAVAGVADT